MSAKLLTNEAEKAVLTASPESLIAALLAFRDTVVENTKNESVGKSGNAKRESATLIKVLGMSLGRSPTSAEVARFEA